ncbi:MAG: fatty acid desaturase [Myxococcales bacterium]|nr:fatty acid desaturase [Myxococcales bacterium]
MSVDMERGTVSDIPGSPRLSGHPRSGPELIRASKPFSEEDSWTTWRLFITTVAVAAVCFWAAAWKPAGPFRYIGAIVLGLTNVRLFIFYHDTMHGALFRDSPLGKLVMRLYGLLILVPDRVWKDSHNYHHSHNAKIVGASIGSFPILTVRMWRKASSFQRLLYRMARGPVNMIFGYFTVFLLGMVIRPLIKNPTRNYSAMWSLVIHYASVALITYIADFETAFLAFLFPVMLSCALGSYLFYAQHNFPDAVMKDRQNWTYTEAALLSSSMMTGGPVMRWFTGDIGFHHVHHLNSSIPFYRLEETMNALPELQAPGKTSLSLIDIWRCFDLDLWDPEAGRMVSIREAEAHPEMRPAI